MKDWTTALSEAIQSKADVVPKGFKTRRQICEETGLTRNQFSDRINAVKNKEVKKFNIVIDGALRAIPHYRLK